ncbi:hypothetical protein [Halalkalibacter hemicellulosilyticus]|uniref:Uncharacterized protein n=1 Tax=Halalkalibacter hemicellulosilyticusJCM 9152 TaxID=1236971 RepID=W4QFH1_9BACI|nr:hypothetical protein [Halalkalibacter hemicellulosilyticus]GAE30850.1 hypothetical protein JCM9152_2273 [Halalkalibacter hemicellulosilyticusJCM 9152]
MSKKTVILIAYVLTLLFFLRSVTLVIFADGTGGYGMIIVSALVMTFLLRWYLKERQKDVKKDT